MSDWRLVGTVRDIHGYDVEVLCAPDGIVRVDAAGAAEYDDAGLAALRELLDRAAEAGDSEEATS